MKGDLLTLPSERCRGSGRPANTSTRDRCVECGYVVKVEMVKRVYVLTTHDRIVRDTK